MSSVLDKFLRYVKIDTQSNPYSKFSPSTEKQKDLARLLLTELKTMGLEAFMDDYSYVYAKIPSNCNKKGYKIGLIAHLDTSFDAPGHNVNPRIINNYKGDKIILNEFYQMDPISHPILKNLFGDDLVVTDGNTLLGADDKAGIAEIMQAISEIISNPNFFHDDIYIAFTPDEEIGRGTQHFNFDYFKADFAYTLDGSQIGSIEYENFNAASLIVEAVGKSIHPGDAKDKLVNATKLLIEFNSLLPSNEVPEKTDGYEGFYHLTNLKATTENGQSEYIIRDHDFKLFNDKKELVAKIVGQINKKYGYEALSFELADQYYNMQNHFKDKEYIITHAINAIKQIGLTPISNPIRGGTDGAMLTYQGLPCPNLGTGGYNYHGRYELASINEMEQAVEIIKEIVRIK